MRILYQLTSPMERTVLGAAEVERRRQFLRARAAGGVDVVVRSLADGPPSIESEYEGALVVQQIRGEGEGRGFNAANGEWVDMLKQGIIDPAKVTRSALQNAASIAAIVLTAESAVVEKPEDEEADVGGAGHMH